MISTESRMISGLRRSSTPSDPAAKRITASARYQETSGPCIDLPARVRVMTEHYPSDRRDEQHDRRDLEREQVIGEEEPPDLRRRAEGAVDLRRVGEAAGR